MRRYFLRCLIRSLINPSLWLLPRCQHQLTPSARVSSLGLSHRLVPSPSCQRRWPITVIRSSSKPVQNCCWHCCCECSLPFTIKMPHLRLFLLVAIAWPSAALCDVLTTQNRRSALSTLLDWTRKLRAEMIVLAAEYVAHAMDERPMSAVIALRWLVYRLHRSAGRVVPVGEGTVHGIVLHPKLNRAVVDDSQPLRLLLGLLGLQLRL
mmetsp:Transcript_20223/g.56358  ORF Transcript_20223/g.56358 Transcript_20223/m.56358 type:complete len:208 (-) Transcript_20223:875-1498(-)